MHQIGPNLNMMSWCFVCMKKILVCSEHTHYIYVHEGKNPI